MSPRFDSPPPSPNSFSRPRPRPPKSPAESARIRVQNRRREYLARHPDYYNVAEHELVDPLLYDSLIRRFQSPAEREAEGRAQGYARMLEGSLLRGEERLAKMAESYRRKGSRTSSEGTEEAPVAVPSFSSSCSPVNSGIARPAAEFLGLGLEETAAGDEDDDEVEEEVEEEGETIAAVDVEMTATIRQPRTREDGRARWEAFLRERFVRGDDEEFEYGAVDADDEYDVLERRDLEEAWFEDEDPQWATMSDEEDDDDEDDGGRGVEDMRVDRVLEGETGIQDF